MASLAAATAALERTLRAIGARHPDLRPCVVTLYKHPAGDRRGHYAPGRWATDSRDLAARSQTLTKVDEIHVDAMTLDLGPTEILHTLLHEAAHSIARARNIQDTSRQGRYHNAAFATLAAEVGLATAKEPQIGIITTGLLPGVALRYAEQLDDLRAAISVKDTTPPQPKATPTKGESFEEADDEPASNRQRKLVCTGCQRIIRASATAIAAGPIACLPCQALFVETH